MINQTNNTRPYWACPGAAGLISFYKGATNKKILFLSILPFLSLNMQFAQAAVVIEFSDVGSDLFFSWSGSLDASAGDGVDPIGAPTYATISRSNDGNFPIFYSAPQGVPPYVSGLSFVGTNHPGLFATSAPYSFQNIMPGSTSTGLPFMFRVNHAVYGTTSVDVWGDWGAANTPFTGTMTIANQSIASMGIVDGYTLQLNGGDISFLEVAAVPIPAAAWLFGSALLGLGAIKRRKA